MLPLVEQRLPQIAAVCERHRVKRLELFGSAACAGATSRPNDLDFFVEFLDYGAPTIADQWFGLQEDLEALLGLPVDLTSPRVAKNPYFLAVASPTRLPLYAA